MKSLPLWLLAASGAFAACTAGPAPRAMLQDAAAPAAEAGWTGSASILYYSLPDEPDYVSPVVTADNGPLHLEVRHNYEDRDTSSAWAGWNFGVDDDITIEATAMVGAVFGDTDGLAPGYRLTMGAGDLELTTEGEYLFDFEDHRDNYFYSWTELTYAATDWLWAGVVSQRTRVFEMQRELDLGLLVGAGQGPWSVSAYFFEPWDGDRYVAFAAGVDF